MFIRMLTRQAFVLSCVFGMLALSACGGNARVPDDNFYRLMIMSPQPAERAVLAGTLQVNVDAAAPIYRDRSLLYSDDARANRLQRYHYHHWIDSPPRLLQYNLVQYLRAAGVADQVVATGNRRAAEYQLHVELERFEHVRGLNKVELQVRFVLTSGSASEQLFNREIQLEKPVSGRDVTAVVAAYEAAVSELYAEIVVSLKGL